MQSACSYSIRTTAGVKKSSTLVLSSSRADSDETPPADLKELVASPTNLWELRASDTASMSSTTESMASRSSPRAVSSALHAHDRRGATIDPVQSSLSMAVDDDWLATEALACCGCGSALHDGAAAVSPVVSRFCSEARGAFTRLELGITGTRSASRGSVVVRPSEVCVRTVTKSIHAVSSFMRRFHRLIDFSINCELKFGRADSRPSSDWLQGRAPGAKAVWIAVTTKRHSTRLCV